MPRPTEDKAKIEAERLRILHDEQKKLRTRMQREINVVKGGNASGHLPGEENAKRQLAVFFKVGIPGISFTEIGSRIGETKTTVRKWFREDPDVKEFYEFVLNNVKDSALEFIGTYQFEAIETLALLMRFGSERYMYEASRELLGMYGISKVAKQEGEFEHKKSHQWADREELVNEIRQLNPEQQEAAVEALEKFEELLASQPANSGSNSLQPLNNEEEDDDSDES